MRVRLIALLLLTAASLLSQAQANADIIREILGGAKSARRDVVLLNAAAALVASGKADSIGAALPLAIESIDSGAAKTKLDGLVEFTNRSQL